MVSGLTFQPLIHFSFVSYYDVGNQFSLVISCASFPHCIVLPPLCLSSLMCDTLFFLCYF